MREQEILSILFPTRQFPDQLQTALLPAPLTLPQHKTLVLVTDLVTNLMAFPLPRDLIQGYLIPNFLLDSIRSEKDFGTKPLPAALLVVQFVNKQFYTAVKNTDLAWKAIVNFRNQSYENWENARSKLMAAAARDYGSFSLMSWLHTKMNYPYCDVCCSGAAKGGHTELFEWLEKSAGYTSPHALDCASSRYYPGEQRLYLSIPVIEWAIKNFVYFNGGFYHRVVRDAVIARKKEVVSFLLSRQDLLRKPFVINYKLFTLGITVEMLNFLLVDMSIEYPEEDAGDSVAAAGLEVMKWVFETQKRPIPEGFMSVVAEHGSLDSLTYIYEKCNDREMEKGALPVAALFSQRLENVRFVIEKGHRPTLKDFAKTCEYMRAVPIDIHEYLLSRSIFSVKQMKKPIESALADEYCQFIPLSDWKFYHNTFGIRPTLTPLQRASSASSYLAPETFRYLLEIVSPQVDLSQLNRAVMRVDCWAILKEKISNAKKN